jgi:hypothetical protein
MFSYFTKAIQHSRDAYQKGVGLDSITHGTISRDYIPRVASQLSKASVAFFQRAARVLICLHPHISRWA